MQSTVTVICSVLVFSFSVKTVSKALSPPLCYSAYEGQASDLELGDEVEYTLTRKSSKHSAENIKKLTPGTIPINEVSRHWSCVQMIPHSRWS